MLKQITAAVMLLSTAALMTPANAAMYGGSAPSSGQHMMSPPAMQMMVPWKRITTKKGRIWADSRGFALYTFDKDPLGHSTCYGQCAVAWPPFYAGMGAQAYGVWSIVYRFGFVKQWAYKGKPLYFWFKDTAPGQVTGDGVNGFHVAR